MSFPDLMVRQGVIDHPPKTPIIMGFECAGVVEVVGANVTEFAVSRMYLWSCFVKLKIMGTVFRATPCVHSA